jgi:hypothetical protein
MRYLSGLLCQLFGHRAYTVSVVCPHDPDHPIDVLELCLRCAHIRALVDLVD